MDYYLRVLIIFCIFAAIILLGNSLFTRAFNPLASFTSIYREASSLNNNILIGRGYERNFQSSGHLHPDIIHRLIPVESMDESDEARTRNKELMRYQGILQTSKIIKERPPDIFFAGSKKCGTVWMKFILGWHPSIRTVTHPDELANFLAANVPYENHFPDAEEDKLVLETEMVYLRRFTPEMTHAKFPNVKFLMVVCEPSARFFSDFVHKVIGGKLEIQNVTGPIADEQYEGYFDLYVKNSLPEAKRIYANYCVDGVPLDSNLDHHGGDSIFWIGMYYPQLFRYVKYYSRERFHIINGEDLYRRPGKVAKQVQEFLGIPQLIISDDFVRNSQTGLFCIKPTIYLNGNLFKTPAICLDGKKGRTRPASSRRKASKESLSKLKSFYKCFDNKFFEFMGQRLW